MPERLEVLTDEFVSAAADFITEVRHYEQPDFEGSAREEDGWDSPLRTGFSNMWLALVDETIVGTVGLLDLGKGDGALHRMYVHPEYRGTGTAMRLLNELIQWAQKTQIQQVYLATSSQQQAALRFYEKHGFSRISGHSVPASLPQSGIEDTYFQRTI